MKNSKRILPKTGKFAMTKKIAPPANSILQQNVKNNQYKPTKNYLFYPFCHINKIKKKSLQTDDEKDLVIQTLLPFCFWMT
jgi:hypothetical protein